MKSTESLLPSQLTEAAESLLLPCNLWTLWNRGAGLFVQLCTLFQGILLCSIVPLDSGASEVTFQKEEDSLWHELPVLDFCPCRKCQSASPLHSALWSVLPDVKVNKDRSSYLVQVRQAVLSCSCLDKGTGSATAGFMN